MRPGSSAREQRLTAVTPPKRLISSETSRIAPVPPPAPASRASRSPGRSDMAREAIALLQHAQDAARQEQHHDDDDRAEEELVQVDEVRPHQLLEDEEAHRAYDWPPHRPLPAEQRHHHHRDRERE